jgi:UDP-N-acetylglucosamine 2-epimerase (non-hydrolysing)/UDP-GlcNAc3NAcA epimerase
VRVATVIGNRPQFVKAAAVSGPLRAAHEEILIHTGQHYDEEMSQVFFAELGLPAPEHRLDLGEALGASNTAQTAHMLAALEPLLLELRPDVVLVYGDTNSTLAGGLAAAQLGVPVAHVEAGMRSYDRSMPEELNRVLTDHLSTLLLCSSNLAAENLAAEGLAPGAIVVGDVMVDVSRLVAPALTARGQILERLGVTAGEYLLVTAHRAGTVDDPARLRRLVELLEGIAAPTVLPLHPRTRARLQESGLLDRVSAAVRVCEPLGYLDFAALLVHARAVLTDSGGVQKEAYLAGVPCVTLRARTEWLETVEAGWNELVDLDAVKLRAALARPRPAAHPPLYGDGHAAERVVAALEGLAISDAA